MVDVISVHLHLKLKKPKCILISINMAIAWTKETAKFQKLKNGCILKLKYRAFRLLGGKKKKQKNRKKTSDFEIHISYDKGTSGEDLLQISSQSVN